jgi:hypothetical protein
MGGRFEGRVAVDGGLTAHTGQPNLLRIMSERSAS